jgi:hypothetical protein
VTALRSRAVWLYVLLVGAFFYQPLSTQTFYFRDLYRLFYPKRLFLAAALRSGQIPLWDPMTQGGVPFLANPSNFALHPSNVLYLVLPVLAAFNLVLVLHVLFCAVAAYWLARDSGLSMAAAFVAGIGYAFCGFTLSSANLTPLLLGLPWIPATIALAQRAIRESRSLLPAAVAAAMPLYGGAAELTAMMFVVLTVWFVFAPGLPRKRAAVTIAFLLAGAAGFSLLQTLPATGVLAESSRGSGLPYATFTAWSVAPQRLPELVVPHYFGDTDSLDDARYTGRQYETGGYPYIISIYFGIPLLLLAACGARQRPMLAALAVLALLLSLGKHLPGFRLIYDYVPLVTIFRYPVKAQIAALLPVAILAAYGVQYAQRPRARQALAGVAGMAAIALALVSVHAALVAAAFAVAVWSRREWAIAAVVAADLLIAGWGVNDFAPRSIYDPPPLTAAVRATVQDGRFYAATKPSNLRAPTDDLMWLAQFQIRTFDDYNAPLFGIRSVYHTDYDGLAPVRMARIVNAIDRMPWPVRKGLLDRTDVRGILAPVPLHLPGLTEVATMPIVGEPLRLYANAGAVPARFVSSAIMARGDASAARLLLAQRDLSRVILEAPPAPLGNCGTAAVTVLTRTINSARYQLDAPCDGYLVLAENHYPGWTATLDGHPATHVRADYAFTAIPVPRGRHTITRRYFPPRLLAGLAGVVITALLLFALDRRRTRTLQIPAASGKLTEVLSDGVFV